MRIRVVGVVAIVGTLSMLGAAAAQQYPAAAPAATAPAGTEKSIEGTVKSLDASGKMLTLQDGTQLMIPADVKISRTELKAGANVKVSYEEKGGLKVVKNLEVKQ